MILACRRPWCITLDTLYNELLASGVGGMGENHSTYARWDGTVANEGNKMGMDVVGS